VLEAAHVLDARAGEELLESYEPERFPVDARNTQRAVENAMNHGALIRAIGIDPEDDPAVNVERSRLLWSDSAEGEALREVAHPVIASQSMEFN
jgi:2,4-dichlorophenol 6-monooxygenase